MSFQNDSVPGLMYGLSAVLLFVSCGLCFTFPDTKDKVLEDTYEQKVTVKDNKIIPQNDTKF